MLRVLVTMKIFIMSRPFYADIEYIFLKIIASWDHIDAFISIWGIKGFKFYLNDFYFSRSHEQRPNWSQLIGGSCVLTLLHTWVSPQGQSPLNVGKWSPLKEGLITDTLKYWVFSQLSQRGAVAVYQTGCVPEKVRYLDPLGIIRHWLCEETETQRC